MNEVPEARFLAEAVEPRVTAKRLRTSMDFSPKWVGRDDAGARQVQNELRLAVGVLFHFH